MKHIVKLGILLSITASLAACYETNEPSIDPVATQVSAASGTLKAFKSEAERKKYFEKIKKKQSERRDSKPANYSSDAVAPPAEAQSVAKEESSADSESITNTQHAGVDEGGIVKNYGDYLVILRRGRLFTVAVGDNSLKPISELNAFGDDIEPSGSWYDEMLISGNTITVIGYSYSRGGTEVGLFNIDKNGGLSYRSTYHLRSNDYYSSRNYASRLIGDKLVFYSPSYINVYDDDYSESFPAVRRWSKGFAGREDGFRSISPATRVYLGSQDSDEYFSALHSVTVCDLGKKDMDCKATALIGPPGNVFYVSPTSVYVWTSSWENTSKQSIVYKMPLDGSAPSAIGAKGSPVDQFSFLESPDGNLNVVVRSDGGGNWMWNSEDSRGDVALVRFPTSLFSNGSTDIPQENYTKLPTPTGHTFQNKFVGDNLLYGTGNGWGRVRRSTSKLYSVNWKIGGVSEVELPHGVDRIENLGKNAVVVGTDGRDLHFSAVDLSGKARLAGKYVYTGGSQGELRSHGFFYKPDGERSGIFGLPVRGSGQPGYKHLTRESSSIVFVKNDALDFSKMGELYTESSAQNNDGCRASCVDWYGNSRPIFVKGRIFALLGYEIVEGKVDRGKISEVNRVSFSPGSRHRS